VKNVPRLKARLGKNTVLMIDEYYHLYLGGKEAEHGPLFYQVEQVTRDKAGNELTKAVRSNITEPSGRVSFRPPPNFLDAKGQVVRHFGTGTSIVLSVTVALEDQYCDLCGAEVVTTSGDWTGHFWTSRREGERIYAVNANRFKVVGSVAQLEIPFHH